MWIKRSPRVLIKLCCLQSVPYFMLKAKLSKNFDRAGNVAKQFQRKKNAVKHKLKKNQRKADVRSSTSLKNDLID